MRMARRPRAGIIGAEMPPDRGTGVTDVRQVWIFVVSVLLLSWSFEALIIFSGGISKFGPLWLIVLMCIPGALSILLRLIFKSGFADVGFRLGVRRYYAYAIAVPLLLALLVGLISSALDIRHFSLVTSDALVRMGVIALSLLGLGVVGAAGEEIGWRGFLLPRLVNAGATHPYLATALVWAIWHLPLIALGGFYRTDSPWLMALVYGLGIVAMSFLISELRMRSGSVWVAATIHAAHNFFFQFAMPALILTSPGPRSAWWDMVGGDTGLSVAALYAGAYLVLLHVSRRHEKTTLAATPHN